MRTGRGLARRMMAAFCLLSALVVGTVAALYATVIGLCNSARLVDHSESVLASTERLDMLIVDLETGQRGIIATGDQHYLHPWKAARIAFPREYAELGRLARADGPDERRRAAEITQMGGSYLRDSGPLVEAAKRNPSAVRADPGTESGEQHLTAIRGQLDRLAAAQRKIIAVQSAKVSAAVTRAVVVSVSALAAWLLLSLVFAAYLTRVIVWPVRRAAGMARDLAAGDLTVRMPENSPAELGMLQRSFNTMACSLESKNAAVRRNAEELRASRARVVTASDETRRRIERNLHDGTQQQLISLGLELRAIEEVVPEGHARQRIVGSARRLAEIVEELQEISRGLHPAILSTGGLEPALKALRRRAAVPMELDVNLPRRLPEPVEVAVYYTVSEAVANAAKHSGASAVRVGVEAGNETMCLSVSDDGVGGANVGQGSGLLGIRDRVEALGGRLWITSPAERGTSLRAEIPIGR